MAGLTALLDYFEQRNENERINEWAKQRYADNPDMLNLMQASPSMAREAAQRAMAAELDPELQMRKQFLNSAFGSQQPQQSALGQLGQQNPMQMGPQIRQQPSMEGTEKALAVLNPEAYLQWKLTEPQRQLEQRKEQFALTKQAAEEQGRQEEARNKASRFETAYQDSMDKFDRLLGTPETTIVVDDDGKERRVGGQIADAYQRATPWTTGRAGALGRLTGGPESIGLQKSLSVLKANQVLDKMLELKAASPTGATGFGSMNEKELETIQSSIASLDESQSEEDIKKNLLKLDTAMRKAKDKIQTSYQRMAGPTAKSDQSSVRQIQGKVYVNPQTGQRITKVNGEWVTLQ